jgi:HSP20 family protein
MLWSELERLGRFWDPWQEFERMSRALSRMSTTRTYDFPLINLWVSGDTATVITELPGIDPANIDINVVDGTLVLKGNREAGALKDDETYHRRERWQGAFSKSVELPFRVEVDKVKAAYKKGILTIELPRAEADKPKKVSITVN